MRVSDLEIYNNINGNTITITGITNIIDASASDNELVTAKALYEAFDFILNPVIKPCQSKIYTSTHTIPNTCNKVETIKKITYSCTPTTPQMIDRIDYYENGEIFIEEDVRTKSYTTRKGSSFIINKDPAKHRGMQSSYKPDTYTYIWNGLKKVYEVKVREEYNKYMLDNILNILENEEDYIIEYTIDNMKDLYPELYEYYIPKVDRNTMYMFYRDRCGNIIEYGKDNYMIC